MLLSLLARADGFIVPGLAALYLLLKRKVRAALICAVVLAAGCGIYEAWRYHYYHALLPNTYYVKVAGPLWPRMKNAVQQLTEVASNRGLLPYLMVFPFIIIEALKKAVEGSSRFLDEVRFDILLLVAWTSNA